MTTKIKRTGLDARQKDWRSKASADRVKQADLRAFDWWGELEQAIAHMLALAVQLAVAELELRRVEGRSRHSGE